jgi:hypothetical protein
MAQQLVFARLRAFAKHDKGDDRLAQLLVGSAADTAFVDVGMAKERCLDLAGADAMPAGFDDLALPADQPKEAVFVLVSEIPCA